MSVLCRMGRILTIGLLTFLAASPVSAQFQPGGEVVFENGENALDILFELNSDKIYLQVEVNNRGPYWLVLDTGSPGMILDTRVAEELNIQTDEGYQVGGAGEKPFTLEPTDSVFDAVLPGMTLLDQPALVGGIDAVVGPFEGRRIDGVLGGYNIFANFVVEIDYGTQKIGVYKRDIYAQPDNGTVVPITIEGGHCVIEATSVLLNGDTLTGEFMLDTGLRGTMVFNTPFVNEHDLLTRCGKTIYTTTGGGVGGEVKSHVGRLKDFVFGGFSLGGLHAGFSQISFGAFASEEKAGIIGAAVLQRFRVVFDYAGERLILLEHDYNEESLDFDKSGMFLVSDVDDRSVYRVIDVIEGSPADEAGLEPQDIIREIDGTTAKDTSLEQIRRLFRREAGTTFSIVYQRDGRLNSTKLTLRKVI
ncbi:MAG: aspartyl protease family protein [Candidatus Latescibacterota bacterium]|nr:MAG: aspartyl protease family protein [Candidatus Latescibacterota bacterium]